MSERKIEHVVLKSGSETKDDAKPGSPEFAALPPSEQKARLARVLDRSFSVDRLRVNLPPDVYGEWVPSDPVSVAEAELKGLQVDEVYAPQSAVGRSNRHIDCIFMTMPKITHDVIESMKLDEYNRIHNPKKNNEGKIVGQAEDKTNSPEANAVGLPIISESQTSSVTGDEILSATSPKT